MRRYKVKTYWTEEEYVEANSPVEAITKALKARDLFGESGELLPLKEVEKLMANTCAELVEGGRKSVSYYQYTWSCGLRGKRKPCKEFQEWLDSIKVKEVRRIGNNFPKLMFPIPEKVARKIKEADKYIPTDAKLALAIERQDEDMCKELGYKHQLPWQIGISYNGNYFEIRHLPFNLDLSHLYTEVMNAKRIDTF